MTTYTTHADALFTAGAPILGTTAQEARDNLVSVTEGDATAPKIASQAMIAPVAGTTETLLTLLGSTGASTTQSAYPDDFERSEPGRSMGFVVLVPGTIRITFDHGTASGTSETRVMQDGSAVQTWTGTAGYTTRTVDLTISVGETITIQNKLNATGPANIRNVFIQSTTANMAVA